MQEFYINKGSQLPTLALEVINDGRRDFHKFWIAIQNADVYFTMINKSNGIIKISNAPCYVKKREDNGCTEQYIICYDWKKRDTNESGIFQGIVNIEFNGDKIKDDNGITYPSSNLVVPISEELEIVIKD